MVSVCVGIPTYSRDKVLLDTLDEVISQTFQPNEIIVCDQNSPSLSGSATCLARMNEEGKIRWLKGSPPSLTAARNRIVSVSKSEVIVFIDDDVLLPTNFVEQCVTCFREKRVVCLQCQIHQRKDDVQIASLDRSRPGTGCFPQFEAQEPHNRHSLLFGCHAVRREVAIDVGGYDEQFVGPAFGEDVEFGQRIRRAGYNIHFEPNFWLIHLKAPQGGCRISDWPEWTKSANMWLSIVRYGMREGRFTILFWASLRHGPLLKRNVVQFWRQPLAWASYVFGMVRGIIRGLSSARSPFTSP